MDWLDNASGRLLLQQLGYLALIRRMCVTVFTVCLIYSMSQLWSVPVRSSVFFKNNKLLVCKYACVWTYGYFSLSLSLSLALSLSCSGHLGNKANFIRTLQSRIPQILSTWQRANTQSNEGEREEEEEGSIPGYVKNYKLSIIQKANPSNLLM